MATTQQKHDQEHQLQCERDSKRWAAWINSRLRKAIKGGELEPLEHLRNFVVAFDNMPAAERQTLSTMREVVVNLDWLCALAKLGVASDRRRRSSQGSVASPRSPPEVSPRRRADWATPPRPPMPLALSADER